MCSGRPATGGDPVMAGKKLVVLVTGASSGFGHMIARDLADDARAEQYGTDWPNRLADRMREASV